MCFVQFKFAAFVFVGRESICWVLIME